MKQLLAILVVFNFLTPHKVMADNIIIKGDTLWTIFSSPFDSYPGIVKLREQLKDYSTRCTEDNCSFLSTWKITGNRLMLVTIQNCQCNEKKQTARLKSLFGKRLKNGMLEADWFTGEIWVTKDKPNSWGGMFAASWPRETRLIVKNGVVTSINNYVYPEPVITVYYTNRDSLNTFFYTHMDWSKFHDLPAHSNWAYFRFDQDAKGYLVNLRQDQIIHSRQNFDNDEMSEFNRVAGLLQWPLYFYHAEPVKNFNGIGIILSKAIQEKYAKAN